MASIAANIRACHLLVAFVLTTASMPVVHAQQQNRSRPFAPGSCGPVDPSYIRMAEDTGGMPFFFQRSEVAQSTKFLLANTSENHVTLLWGKGGLQGHNREFLVPVDATLEHIVFAMSADNHETRMEVFGPGETAITADPHADTTDFTCGRYIFLRRPPPGSYRIHIKGSGRFWVSVDGKSDIFLHGVEFVEPGGRPGHEGMFPIHGQPIIGKTTNLKTSVAGDVKTISFALVTPENQLIETLDLTSRQTERDDHEFAGVFSLPHEPFRLVATGTDQGGHRFQRVHKGLFRPTSISLALVDAPDISAGHTAAIPFQATNLGKADRFRIVAVCANGWPARVDRSEVSLAGGETANLIVSLTVPEGTPAYTGGDLVLTATSENDPSITNGVVHHLSVEPSRK